jgi:hypothetical protein
LDSFFKKSGEKQRTALSQMMRTEAVFLYCSTELKSAKMNEYYQLDLPAKKALHISSVGFFVVQIYIIRGGYFTFSKKERNLRTNYYKPFFKKMISLVKKAAHL